MASSNEVSAQEHTNADDGAVELAKVWAELSKGEKTAEALEKSLAPLEKKIDDLLASLEEFEHLEGAGATPGQTKPSSGNPGGKS